MPGLQRYTDALIRKNPTLNTELFCESLYSTLLKKPNVDVKLESYVSGYVKEASTGNVKGVLINFEEEIPSDIVVLCMGP